MKLLLVLIAFVAASQAFRLDSTSGLHWVNGQRNEYHEDMSWMMMGSAEHPMLAILKGPESRKSSADLPNEVRFWLYTSSNPNNGYRLMVGDNANLAGSNFNSNNPTKFVIHGFTNSIVDDAIQLVKNAYLATGSYNVIGVDWGDLAGGPNYDAAKRNIQEAGPYVSLMMDHVVSAGGAAYNRIHCVGHSLGAHMCGIAGWFARGTVARVTGLDAAMPLFPNDPNEWRLDPSDAAFVDAIHTCGGWLGFKTPVGHADYYPNGGVSVQPGCGLDLTGACSHGRSYEYFDQSIRNKNRFPAHACPSLDSALDGACASGTSGVMGEGASTSARGLFWLTT